MQSELTEIRKSVRNALGAIESNQVVDKDVHGTLSRVLSRLDALAAALSDKQAGEVKIKPLEWDDRSDENSRNSYANTRIGRYEAFEFRMNLQGGPKTVFGWCSHWSKDQSADSFEAAKAAAQADYEQRIRSALVDVPAVEPVAYLRLESRTDIDGETYTGLQMSDVSDERAFPVYTSPLFSREGEDSADASFMTLVSRYGDAPTQEGFDQIYRRYLSDCERAATRSVATSASGTSAIRQIGESDATS